MAWFLKTETAKELTRAENLLIPVLRANGFGEEQPPFSAQSGYHVLPLDPRLLGSLNSTAGHSTSAGSATSGHATYSWDWNLVPGGTYYGNDADASGIINISQTDKDVGSIITGVELDNTSKLVTHLKFIVGGKEGPWINCEELYSQRSDIDPEGFNGLGFFPEYIILPPEISLLVECVFRTSSTVKTKFRLTGYAYVKHEESKRDTGARYQP